MGALRFSQHHQRSRLGQGTLTVYILCLQVRCAYRVTEMGDPHKMIETSGGPRWMLHTLGALLLIARLSHAYGISSLEAPGKFRVAGMAGTFTTIVISALWLINNYVISL